MARTLKGGPQKLITVGLGGRVVTIYFVGGGLADIADIVTDT